MTILEKYKDSTFKYYKGFKFEVLIFDKYIWGKPRVLIKYKKYNKFDGAFVETIGGQSYSRSGSDGIDESIYKLKNIFEENIEEVSLTVDRDRILIAHGTNFEFIDRDESVEPNLENELLLELPAIKAVEFISQFRDEPNKYIIVDKDKYDHSVPNRFFIGTISDYKLLEIENFTRYRDGGTTIIEIANGFEFLYPSPFNKSAKSFWSNNEGKKFELNQIEGEYSHHTKMFLSKLGINSEN